MEKDYLPVPLRNIQVNSYPDFDLYLKQADNFVLYRKASYRFSQEHLDNLIDSRVDLLYLERRDLKRFENYCKKIRAESAEDEEARPITHPVEVAHYHDIMENYFAVNGSLLLSGLELEFPVFCRRQNRTRLFPEFEQNPEGPWHLDENVSHCNKEVMIKMEDLAKYQALLQKLFEGGGGGAPENGKRVRQKAIILKELSKIMIQEMLADPRSGEKIKNLRNMVNTTVDFIMENESSFYTLMRIHAFDFYTYVHSLNVCTLCVGLGSAIGLFRSPDLELLALGGSLHDIGKSQLDPKLINKPEELNESEYEVVKTHVNRGVELLKDNPDLPDEVLSIVSQHHERLSGNGYPNGLKGDEISLYGQISSIVDVYDALTTDRPYRKALSPFDALKIIAKTEDDFEQTLMKKFILMLGSQIVST